VPGADGAAREPDAADGLAPYPDGLIARTRGERIVAAHRDAWRIIRDVGEGGGSTSAFRSFHGG
jgi:hypothetical protein